MKTEERVSDLKYSKRIKELGIKQESCWWWRENCDGNIFLTQKAPIPHKKYECGCKFYSAFTVAELGEILPDDIETHKKENCWFCSTHPFSNPRAVFECKTEANVKALMLICLKENNLI